ncbi:HAMP domain-containing sensor histidine kinase [Sphingomonas sp. PP-CC-1A-547]|uniref:sensor histidine kinase n=1 Tax=Sphingomonas sp. PP-CC-1A-547 TaxID=2135654 RepID=UPI000FF85C5A|nr:HAMP domain-containing sensor histidine kinase [Sphingomonas sp. PP-CC-1A-547]RKE53240.1 phospho-acceptor domain-containing protein [Sphingomonas sp. PP-CC-1A-547]
MLSPLKPGNDVRFDDSLKTILAADMATDFGAQSAWRQLVDLMGRGRAVVDEPAIARLRLLRQAVPVEVRAASARALAFAKPDARLVGFFAEDVLAIAAPVLRTATLEPDDWLALLPRLTPPSRSVLRHRRDLPAEVQRGLQSFGPTDFVLPQPEAPIEMAEAEPVAPEPIAPEPIALEPAPIEKAPVRDEPVAKLPEPAPTDIPELSQYAAPLSETPFMALGAVARGLPFVAEAFRHAKLAETEPPVPAPEDAAPADRFEISDLVARIEAFNRDRTVDAAAPAPAAAEIEGFRFETDAQGIIRMVDGVARSALVGVSLAYAAQQGEAHLDGVAAGAFRRRSRFSDARLEVGGLSDAFGSWRLSGVPAFEHASGRFIGFRGTGRRPRRDETAEPVRVSSPVSDSLRQLVHELRTPTNAIAGFAELIETQLLGPVSPTYRDRATTIRTQAGDLLAAIDDLDTAARIEGRALDLRPTTVPVRALLDRVARDLQPLATLRGTSLGVAMPAGDCDILGDDRAVERLIGRLLAALVSAGRKGEQLGVVVRPVADTVTIEFDRPAALAAHATDVLLSIDAEHESDGDGAPLLGTGFALRLAQNLAVELGGVLTIGADRLTLQLPAADTVDAERTADEQR